MVRSRPVGLFVLALCLVACVCAHAVVRRDEAAKIANEVQKSTKRALENLKLEVVDAIRLRNDAKTCKQNAEKAAKEAEKAVQGNTEAEAIVEEAKNASAEVLKLYPNAFELADKYAESMKTLRTRAQELDDRARRELFVSEWQEGDYTKTKDDADAIKAEAEAFDNEVQDAMKPYAGLVDAQKEMPKFVSAAQRAKYHVDVIVAVAKIDTLLKSAVTDIGLTEKKIAEINATVQEMKNLADSSPKDLVNYISHLQFLVESILSSTSYSIDKAKKAKEDMLEQKKRVDDALGKVKAETDVKNAEKEADVAHWAVKDAEKEVEEIKKALGSVTKSATDALGHKKSALNAINQKTQKPDVTQENDKVNSKDSENTHQPVKDTTESLAGTETKQDKIPIPVKPVSVKPKEDSKENDAGIKDKKPIITTQDQPVGEQPADETTESPEGTETKQDKIPIPVKPVSVKPKEDSKENDAGIKDKKLIITTQDQPKSEQPVDETTESPEGNETEKPTMTNSEQPVSGGTDPIKPSSSDSAMTVSVPLLLAMVACAALH